MTRIVGHQNRDEFIRDPVLAWRHGTRLDRMLAQALPPVPRGVTRAPHHVFNAIDDQRQLAQARKVNSGTTR